MAGDAPLSRLVVRDFQAHEKLVVGLDPHCTVFVGPSDCGKSAVVRALRFALLNGLKGDGFVRHGRRKAVVTVTVGGHTVKRVRGKGVNAYRLDGKAFTAFGQGAVPDEIKSLLNCTPDNFQGQIDPPYWFLDSPGQVSKSLNRIVSLDKIDLVLAALARKGAAKKAELEFAAGRLDDAEQLVEKLAWAKDARADLERLEAAKAEFDSKASRRAAFALSLKKAIGGARRADRLQMAVLGAEKLIETARLARDSRKRAAGLAKLLAEAERAAGLAATDVPDPSKVVAAHKTMHRAADHRGLLELLVRETTTAKEILCGRKEQLAEAERGLAKATKGKCPVCSRSWSPTSTCDTGHQ